MPDAIVIGAGPNGLVAANLLASAGWEVLVLEAQPEPGGAVRTRELIEPGFRNDVFSAFYPLAARSPAMAGLGLERHGLRWRRAPVALAHPAADGRCAVLSTSLEETAASLDSFAPGDGDRWRELSAYWERVGTPFFEALMRPFPPVRAGAALLRALGPRGTLEFARFALLSVRRLAEERFDGEGAGWLLAGNALHTDVTPDSAAGGLYGWMLCGLGQQVGYPFPEGGAGQLTAALVRRFAAAGGDLRCGTRVARVIVRAGRAVGVRTGDGEEIPVRRAVLADAGAPALYRDLLADVTLPAWFERALDRFQYDSATVKVDWTLDGPIPWQADGARRAGTVHVADGMEGLSETSAQLARGLVPRRPFLVMGQYAVADPSRCPSGKETAWAYTHVPQRIRGDAGDELTGVWDGPRPRCLRGASRTRSSGWHRGSATSRAAARVHPACDGGGGRGPRGRSGERRHRPAPPAAAFAPCPDSRGPRRRSRACIWHPPRRTPAAACTVHRVRTPRMPRCARGGSSRGCPASAPLVEHAIAGPPHRLSSAAASTSIPAATTERSSRRRCASSSSRTSTSCRFAPSWRSGSACRAIRCAWSAARTSGRG